MKKIWLTLLLLAACGQSATPPATRIERICRRISDCKCPGADTCAARAAKIERDIAPSYWSCVQDVHAGDCPAVCDEYSGARENDCFSAAAPAMWQARDERARQALAPSAELAERIAKLCEQQRSCGCGADVCETLMAPTAPSMPEAMWTCMEGLAASCACDSAANTACLQASKQELLANQARQLPLTFCARRDACGCGVPTCAATMTPFAADPIGHDLLVCWTNLECAHMCGDPRDASTGAGGCLTRVNQALSPDARGQETMRRMVEAAR